MSVDDSSFTNIILRYTHDMTIWKLVKTCTIPIIIYGAEIWITTKKKKITTAQKILDCILKRILMTTISTPSEILTAETILNPN